MAGALGVACASRWMASYSPPMLCGADALASVLQRLACAAESLAVAGAAAAGAKQSCRPFSSLPAKVGLPELDDSPQPGPQQPSTCSRLLLQQQPRADAAHSTALGNSSGASSGSSSAPPSGTLGLQVTPQALAAAADIMARFPAEAWDPDAPRLVDVAVQLLLELKEKGASEEEQHAACSDGRRLRALRRRLRLSPCLEVLFGSEVAQQLLERRPALLATTPPNMARALAAMALCGVRDPVALAARSPVLLQYRHDSFSFVAARLAMQQYLGLPDAAAVYQRLPTYLLPSALTVACRLQFLEERGLLPCLVARLQGTQHHLLAALQQAVAAAAAQQQQQGLRRRPGRPSKAQQQGQGQQQQQQRGPGRPPRAAPQVPTLSGAVKRGVAEFCLLVGASVEEYQRYEAAFEQHPAWQQLRDRGQRETAQLRAMLQRLEQQVVGAAATRKQQPRQQQPRQQQEAEQAL
ncbi:hypothetical protein ABPG77_008259 [Micractinium sp. CCAP 211/92]